MQRFAAFVQSCGDHDTIDANSASRAPSPVGRAVRDEALVDKMTHNAPQEKVSPSEHSEHHDNLIGHDVDFRSRSSYQTSSAHVTICRLRHICRCVLIALLIAMSPSALADDPAEWVERLLQSAYDQVGKTVFYDPSYQIIAFPGGDVPLDRGVCTDVIVRAYRGVGIDLQILVNRDMRSAFAAYPKLWSSSRPDPNIDHRRVPNLAVFFSRHGKTLAPSNAAQDYKAGDIVTWRLPDGRPHIGLVSDRQSDSHRPLIIHNIGAGAQIEDVLFTYSITGHYRYPAGKN